MRKSIGILSALAILVSMSGCGDNNNSEGNSSSENISGESSMEESSESEYYSDEEESSEEETTKSEEEIKAARIASNTEYLENIQPYLLDFTVCDIADVHFEECFSLKKESYSGFDTATILTVGYDYNTGNTQWIDNIDIIDNEGNSVVQTSEDTSWEMADIDEQIWGVTRYRIAGEYAPEDLRIKLIYDDSYGTSVEKDLSDTATFEEFSQNIYWYEDVNPYWEDADEAEEFNSVKRPYIYKINGVYCFVDEDFGTSSGGLSSGEKHIYYIGRGFDITPLQGILAPVLRQDDVSVESGNTQPYMYCELDEFNENAIDNQINVNICCVTSDTDWYDNWDNLTEEQKMGKEIAEELAEKYMRYEARASYLCVPDGDGGITKIECTWM